MAKWQLIKVEKETESNCWHCGTAIIWSCWVKDEAGTVQAVGRQCCSNFLSRSDTKKAKEQITTAQRIEKLRARIEAGIVRAYESHGPEATSTAGKKQIANWMNVVGASWIWIKQNYPDYYYARFPNEK